MITSKADTNWKRYPLQQYNIIQLSNVNSKTKHMQHIYNMQNAIAILDERGTGRELALNLHTCQRLLLCHFNLIIQRYVNLIYHLAVQFNILTFLLHGVMSYAR